MTALPSQLAYPVIIRAYAGPSPRDEFVYGIMDRQLFRGPSLFRLNTHGIRSSSTRILFVLLANQFKLVPRTDLFSALWGDRLDGGPLTAEKAIDVHIFRLREAQDSIGVRVETDRGWGHRVDILPCQAKAEGH